MSRNVVWRIEIWSNEIGCYAGIYRRSSRGKYNRVSPASQVRLAALVFRAVCSDHVTLRPFTCNGATGWVAIPKEQFDDEMSYFREQQKETRKGE